MSKKVFILVFALIFAVSTMLTGCGTKPASNDAAKPEEPKVLKITYTGTPQPHEKEYIINTFMKNFETKYNAIVEVDFVTQEDGIKKTRSEQESQNIVTDIIFADTANMAPYVNGGWMEDISEVVDNSGSTITNMFDASIKKDGKRYFVPISFDVYITIANKQALKYLPAGLTEDSVVNGLTWEQYAAWANAIAAGEGVGKTMMPANMTGSQLLYPIGGLGMAYGAGFPEFNAEGFKKSMGIIAEMAKGNAFYPEQAQYTAPTDPLKSGAVWLTFAHMGPVGVAYNASPNDYVIGAAPKGENGAGSTAGAWAYGIQKGTKNRELAETFIQYAIDPQTNYELCSEFGGLLSPIKEVGDMLGAGDVIMRAGSKMLETTKVSGVPATLYTDWNAVKLLYGDLFEKILKEKAVPDDTYFADLQGKLEALKK
ncbi:multiple sugar transport system substrate-binding protein [Geosporobacter subterraneus DSM 17957]|uniref:Multiple sugar transport system substrate-binding protein n=1 Tax=Geosporobacter subterraneus DSM 17957 TaxID=1121919 RepID=A0A1M6MMF8_9FIRM|nr:extracellular solute-binding protein [Geosporobacter subterraneus]SHJ84675.1 multiple sugar transport system substrate-binding protein [Geosporobacter subterraneus DSM 17957]